MCVFEFFFLVKFGCWLDDFLIHIFPMDFQADKETDEIYAQMTLQPVISVRAVI